MFRVFWRVCVESEKDSQIEDEQVSCFRQHSQLKLIDKFGVLNSILNSDSEWVFGKFRWCLEDRFSY